MTTQISNLSAEEVSRHIQHFIEMDAQTIGEPWGRSHFLKEMPGKWIFSRVAQDKSGKPVAFAIASLKSGSVHIHRLVTRESHRGMGLGTQLLLSVAEEAQRANVSTMTLKVSQLNAAAVDFYGHLGFRKVARQGENLELAIPIDRMVAPKE